MSSVRLRALRFTSLSIPFTVAFRHASAERAETSSAWVEAVSENDAIGHGESCPRTYVTGEAMASAQAFHARHEASLCARVVDLDSLRTWMDERRDELDENPSAWCAIELAILDLLAIESSVTVETLLGLPPLSGGFQYSAVLGDMSPESFLATIDRYRKHGFTDFKVKLSGDLEHDRDKFAVLRRYPDLRLRVDANNLWRTSDEAIAFLQGLDGPVFAVEEPIGPGEYGELARIAARLQCKVILDESLLRLSQIEHLVSAPEQWLVNLRVSKMGGLLRSLPIVEAARAAGIGLIVGAQVGETSLLTRAALTVASAGRDMLVAQEGAFGTLLLTRDVCEPPLMFGPGGVLDVASFPTLTRPGFGLAISGPP